MKYFIVLLSILFFIGCATTGTQIDTVSRRATELKIAFRHVVALVLNNNKDLIPTFEGIVSDARKSLQEGTIHTDAIFDILWKFVDEDNKIDPMDKNLLMADLNDLKAMIEPMFNIVPTPGTDAYMYIDYSIAGAESGISLVKGERERAWTPLYFSALVRP